MGRRFSGPLIPGTRSVKQKGGRKWLKKRAYGRNTFVPLNKYIKDVQLRTCETKQSSQYTDDLQILYHDRTYYAGQLLATTQGVTDPEGIDQAVSNRNGDEVIGQRLILKMFIEQQANRPNVMYRIYVFKYNTLLIGSPFSATMTDNEFWSGPAGAGGLTNRMLDRPQKKNITVLRTKTIKPTHQANYSIQTAGPVPVGPFTKTNYVMFNINLKNKKIKYRDPNSTFPMRDGYGFAIVAFDSQGTATTDHISNFMWQSTFYYKDP